MFIFASVIPISLFWIGDTEMNRDLLSVSLRVAIGVLITFGLPMIWLAWQSEKYQKPVFTRPLSKIVLVLATISTAMFMASMYNFNLMSPLFLFMFPIGLYGLFVHSGIGSGFMFYLSPIIGWLTYVGISLSIIFNQN